MKPKRVKLADRIRVSLWFVPTILVAGAAVASFVTVRLDDYWSEPISRSLGWAFSGGPEGARAVLSTIAGSMITVAGVTFSITIVALSLASQQFGPRMLRNFMADRGNQLVIGTFVATFIYCLLVLRTVQSLDGSIFVPYISVTVGVLLALASIGVLIYFIHHVSVSIQADHVVASISAELHESIDRLFPAILGHGAESDEHHAEESEKSVPHDPPGVLHAEAEGYIQAIDVDAVLHFARDRDLLMRLCRQPGDFVFPSVPLVEVWPRERLDDRLARSLQEAVLIGRTRTPTQDVEFAIAQLVELAVRSLSPGINDPFTAGSCINRLAAAMARLGNTPFPSKLRYDDQHRLRLIADPPTFEQLARTAFDKIREAGAGRPSIAIHLLEVIALVIESVESEERRQELLRHAKLIREMAVHAERDVDGIEHVEDAYADVLRMVSEGGRRSGAAG